MMQRGSSEDIFSPLKFGGPLVELPFEARKRRGRDRTLDLGSRGKPDQEYSSGPPLEQLPYLAPAWLF